MRGVTGGCAGLVPEPADQVAQAARGGDGHGQAEARDAGGGPGRAEQRRRDRGQRGGQHATTVSGVCRTQCREFGNFV